MGVRMIYSFFIMLGLPFLILTGSGAVVLQ